MGGLLDMKVLNIWTDGSANCSMRAGGWAFVIDDYRVISGGVKDTTNNRMEMYAILMAVNYAIEKGFDKVVIHTDSEVAMTWCRKLTGGEKAPFDLIGAYAKMLKEIDVELVKVKAHSKDKNNDLADMYAKARMKEVLGNRGYHNSVMVVDL